MRWLHFAFCLRPAIATVSCLIWEELSRKAQSILGIILSLGLGPLLAAAGRANLVPTTALRSGKRQLGTGMAPDQMNVSRWGLGTQCFQGLDLKFATLTLCYWPSMCCVNLSHQFTLSWFSPDIQYDIPTLRPQTQRYDDSHCPRWSGVYRKAGCRTRTLHSLQCPTSPSWRSSPTGQADACSQSGICYS